MMDSPRFTALVVEYEDVLKNIESVVLRHFSQQPELTDAQVDRVYELLIRAYKAQVRGGAVTLPLHQLGGTEGELYRRVVAVCEFHLGKGDAPWPTAKRKPATRTPDEIVACLKHLRKSVQFWTKESGRQGYLNYIKPYVE